MRKKGCLKRILALGTCFCLVAFSFLYAQNDRLKSVLKSSFDLRPGFTAGDKDFYHMQTIYTEMDELGKTAQTSVLEGYFSREAKKTDQNRLTETFIWKFVKIAERDGQGNEGHFRVLPFSQDFRYSFSEWKPQQFPVDLSSIPKTMDGWRFFVKLIDAHTFDVIANPDAYDRKLDHIGGDSTLLSEEGTLISMDFPPLFTDTYFKHSSLRTRVLGLTIFHDEPCIILSFKSDNCQVRLVAHMNNMTLPTDGISSYSGEIFFSLDQKKIVWGKIIERVDMTTQLAVLGKPMKHATKREITLEKINKQEFEKAN